MKVVSNVYEYQDGERRGANPDSKYDKSLADYVRQGKVKFIGTIEQEITPPKKKVVKYLTGWMNVYDDGTYPAFHPDKPTADNRALHNRIACIEINQPYEVEEEVKQ